MRLLLHSEVSHLDCLECVDANIILDIRNLGNPTENSIRIQHTSSDQFSSEDRTMSLISPYGTGLNAPMVALIALAAAVALSVNYKVNYVARAPEEGGWIQSRAQLSAIRNRDAAFRGNKAAARSLWMDRRHPGTFDSQATAMPYPWTPNYLDYDKTATDSMIGVLHFPAM